jgi:DNA-binding response OmpR family regulator
MRSPDKPQIVQNGEIIANSLFFSSLLTFDSLRDVNLFTPFRLDPANEQLWCGDTEVRLRRKTFEVLRYLVENPAQLVTKAALLDAVWPQIGQ